MALDPTIPLGVKPIDFLGSAGNLLNLARGAQALEQEQAMNPIQRQKAALDLLTAQETQQAEINRQKGLSRQAVTGADVAEFNQASQIEGALRQTLNPLYRPEWIANAVKNPQQAINDIRLSTDRAIAGGVPVDRAEAYKASMYAVLADAKRANNPDLLENWMFNNLVGQLPPEKQQPLLAPGGAPPVSAAGVPGYAVLGPGGARYQQLGIGQRPQPAAIPPVMPPEATATQEIVKPTFIVRGISETGPAEKQGAGVSLMQPDVAAPAPTQPQGVTAEMMSARPVGAAGAMKMPDLTYPVRPKEGGYFFLPNEESDQKAGLAYNTALTNLLPDLTVNKENLFRVANLATKIEKDLAVQSGPFSAAQRGVEAFFGNPQYKELSKLLANVQLSMLKSGGSSLGTDAGKDLVAKSQGTEMYDPRLLTKIARETLGNVLQKEAEATAANAFVQKYGPQNHNAFKQMWSSNADPKVFEMLAAEKMFPSDKNRRLDAYNSILEGVPDTSSNPNVITKAKLLEKHKAIKSIMQSGAF